MNCLLLLIISLFYSANGVQLISGYTSLNLTFTTEGIELLLSYRNEEKLWGAIGLGANDLEDQEDCEGTSHCFFTGEEVSLNVLGIAEQDGFFILWETFNTEIEFRDCFNLSLQDTVWVGGTEKWQQDWPINNISINRPYTTIKSDNGAVGERYWLNSNGAFIFADDKVPLTLDQNNIVDDNLCLIANTKDPFEGRRRIILEYALIARRDARQAHLAAVDNFLGTPSGHPDEWIIKKPIWTTWAKYKKDINDDIVLAFAQDIADHGFSGQIEIDDYWETCYGSLTFDNDKFGNINQTVAAIHDLGFTVSLWTHPFVNHDCEEPDSYGEENGYFVKSRDGSDTTSWWDGDNAHYIDFTNEDAANWFVQRLQSLQEKHGIDSFKFDSGESDYPPPQPDLDENIEYVPNVLTSTYIRTCASFGGLIEVRSAWRTQDLPIFVRMLDKDSRWGLDNGLHSLITTLLQFNIIGYGMVLPDMIGGNGYGDSPTAELIARWTQANTFMPTMQFSFLPWEVTSDEFDGVAILNKYVALHEQYAPLILHAMEQSISNGIPVNPPIWWIDPNDRNAWLVNDEYLLGEYILVAPVVTEGSYSRNIYLPAGYWSDGNSGLIYVGPTNIIDYPAPIDVLPYFILIDTM